MRRTLRIALLAVAAALPLSAAGAAPFGTRLDPVRDRLAALRDAITPDSFQSELDKIPILDRALAAFGARSTSIDGDLRIFGRVAKALNQSAVGPSELGGTMSDALFGLRADVLPSRDALAARIDGLVSPPLAAKSATSLAVIDNFLNASVAGPGTLGFQSQQLRTAIERIAAADARISRATAPRGSHARPGAGFFASLLDGAPYLPRFGSGVVELSGGQTSTVELVGYDARASAGGVQISWDTGAFTGPGDYALDGTSGAIVILVQRGATFYSDGGTVTVSEFDAAAHRVSGTFDVHLTSDSGAQHAITKGSFVVRFVARGR
jgi:hypothetical protein